MYFEVVTTPAGHHARIRDKHRKEIFVSPVYKTIQRAIDVCRQVQQEAEDAPIHYVTQS